MMYERDKSWEILEKVLEHHDLAFVLGAGISYKLMPTWSQFIDRIADKAGIEWPDDFKRGLPTLATLIRERYDEYRWQELLRRVLYNLDNSEHLTAYQQIIDVENSKSRSNSIVLERQSFIEFLERKGLRTLPAIVNLCAFPAQAEAGLGIKGLKWKKNDRIGAMLTYNFDGLLQFYDRARHGSPRMLRTIERASSPRRRGKIPVYHMHGYLLPFAGSGQDEPRSVVLCEEEYHGRTDEPFSYAMTSMLWALREFTCIFVGCSMTDELMRRTLFRYGREYKKNVRRNSRRANKHFATMERKDSDTDAWIEKDLRNLGVQPLWLAKHDELPIRFADLSEYFKRQETQ